MYCKLYPKIFTQLQHVENDLTPIWVVENNHDKFLLKKSKITPTYNFVDYHRNIFRRKNKEIAFINDTELLIELENTFKYGSLWGMLLIERYIAT